MKKIFFIISANQTGGAERVLFFLANQFSKRGYNIVVLTIMKSDEFYEIDKSIKYYSLNKSLKKRSFLNKIKNNIDIIKQIREIIKKENPDITISFMDKVNFFAILSTLFTKTKIIISERINYEYIRSKFIRLIKRILYPLSDGMVVLSKYDYNKYFYVKNKKIIYNPLWIEESVDLSKKEKVIISVGRLVSQKGFDIFLKALSKIDKDILKDWKVYIIGEGEEREKLENLSKKLKLDTIVSFKGEQKNVKDYYETASIFVSTSRMEGFPNVLLEAMSMGCACIATDCLTGPSEMIKDEVNGFLVEVDNEYEISKRLEILLKNEYKRKNFALNAIETSKRFEKDKILGEWERYIEKIIKGK